MPIARREAEVVWEGSLARGAGNLTSGSRALYGSPVTWAARTEAPNGMTSPEELVAAAHASCFAMALALALVPGLDEAAFAKAIDAASRLCPVSNAFAGNVEIAVEATFDESEAKTRELVDS